MKFDFVFGALSEEAIFEGVRSFRTLPGECEHKPSDGATLTVQIQQRDRRGLLWPWFFRETRTTGRVKDTFSTGFRNVTVSQLSQQIFYIICYGMTIVQQLQ